jgi:hypothetical protein
MIEKPTETERDGEAIARAVRLQAARVVEAMTAPERIAHYLTRDVERLRVELRRWADPDEHALGEFEGGGLGEDHFERYAELVSKAAAELAASIVELGKECSRFEILADRSRVLRAHGIHDVEPDPDR